MGRWMSPDWSVKYEPVPYAKLDDPQTLNLYGYVGNNPLIRADADGHCPCDGGMTAGDLARSFLDIAEVKYSEGPALGVSGQWGVVEHSAQIGVSAEVSTGLGLTSIESKVEVGGSASVKIGKIEASLKATAGVSSKEGANAEAKVEVKAGSYSYSKGVKVTGDGIEKTSETQASGDFKVGASGKVLAGVGVAINVSQAKRAFGQLSDSLNALGAAVLNHFTTGTQIIPSVPGH